MREAAPEVLWDGHDLASIQMLGMEVPRRHGIPAVQVDADWNLLVMTGHVLVSVPVGWLVSVEDDHLAARPIGGPDIEALIDASSLGTPGARSLRARGHGGWPRGENS
jgi:hypothetical protein